MHAHTKAKQPFTIKSSFQQTNSSALLCCAKNGADFEAGPSLIHETLKTPGQPVDPAMRPFMGSRLGHDLSRVLIHTDTQAAASAYAVNAQAYTVGLVLHPLYEIQNIR
jgi:hypothetical protein